MKAIKRLVAITKIKRLQIELDRCRQAARELPLIEREMLHLKLANHALLPPEYQWHRNV